MKLDRYTRLCLAGWYAMVRYKTTGSTWWEDRFLTLEYERQAMVRKAKEANQ